MANLSRKLDELEIVDDDTRGFNVDSHEDSSESCLSSDEDMTPAPKKLNVGNNPCLEEVVLHMVGLVYRADVVYRDLKHRQSSVQPSHEASINHEIECITEKLDAIDERATQMKNSARAYLPAGFENGNHRFFSGKFTSPTTYSDYTKQKEIEDIITSMAKIASQLFVAIDCLDENKTVERTKADHFFRGADRIQREIQKMKSLLESIRKCAKPFFP